MAFLPDIAPSRMFTTNSLCLIICHIHEWRLIFQIFKSNLSSFAIERLHHSLFYLSILFLTYFSSTMFEINLRPSNHIFFFVFGATAPSGPGPPHSRCFQITHNDVHSRQDPSGQATSSSQRPLPNNTQQTDIHALRWDSNPQSQQVSGHRPTPQTARPLGSANYIVIIVNNKVQYVNIKIRQAQASFFQEDGLYVFVLLFTLVAVWDEDISSNNMMCNSSSSSPGATQPIVVVYFTALYRALASSPTRLLDHTQRRATVGRTPLNE